MAPGPVSYSRIIPTIQAPPFSTAQAYLFLFYSYSCRLEKTNVDTKTGKNGHRIIPAAVGADSKARIVVEFRDLRVEEAQPGQRNQILTREINACLVYP